MNNPFKQLFKLGERFDYLGGAMLVVEFKDPYDSDTDPDAQGLGMTRVIGTARMVTRYRDNNGILQEQVFEDKDIPVLLMETTTPPKTARLYKQIKITFI